MLVAPIVNAGTVTFVSDELHESESWYGWLLASQGFGAIAFAGALIVLGPRVRLLPTGFIALIVTGSSVLLLAASGSVVPAIAAMVTMGMGVVGLQVAFASYLQRESEDAYRGRIMGLVATVASIGNLVGLAITPLAVLLLGVRPAFALAGGLIILSALPILGMLRRAPVRDLGATAGRARSRP
jgi:MFS family permease